MRGIEGKDLGMEMMLFVCIVCSEMSVVKSTAYPAKISVNRESVDVSECFVPVYMFSLL